MPEQDPLADVITLVAAPIAGAVRSVEQFRTGVDEFLRGIENFNRTMENLNETAERMNVLLKEVEEPIKAAVPQVTRAINNADEVMQVVSGPAMAAAPGLARLADTMNTPAFQQLPDQLATFSDVLVDMSSRMAPLTQFAETAGGLFGLRKPGAGQRAAGQAAGTKDTAAGEEADLGEAADTAEEPTERAGARPARVTKPPAKKVTSKSLTARARRSGISSAVDKGVSTKRSATASTASRGEGPTASNAAATSAEAAPAEAAMTDEPPAKKKAGAGKGSAKKKAGTGKGSAKKKAGTGASSAKKKAGSGKTAKKTPSGPRDAAAAGDDQVAPPELESTDAGDDQATRSNVDATDD